MLLSLPFWRTMVNSFRAPQKQLVLVLPFSTVGEATLDNHLVTGILYTLTSKLMKLEPYQSEFSVVSANDVLTEGVKNTRQAESVFNVNQVISPSIERLDDYYQLTFDFDRCENTRGVNFCLN